MNFSFLPTSTRAFPPCLNCKPEDPYTIVQTKFFWNFFNTLNFFDNQSVKVFYQSLISEISSFISSSKAGYFVIISSTLEREYLTVLCLRFIIFPIASRDISVRLRNMWVHLFTDSIQLKTLWTPYTIWDG